MENLRSIICREETRIHSNKQLSLLLSEILLLYSFIFLFSFVIVQLRGWFNGKHNVVWHLVKVVYMSDRGFSDSYFIDNIMTCMCTVANFQAVLTAEIEIDIERVRVYDTHQ